MFFIILEIKYRACGLIVPASGDHDDGEFGGMIGRGTEVLGGNLSQCRFVHHKPHILSGLAPGPQRWEASI
jgi:hypothetical protein